ncbi:CHAP domain-containing protein [Staphylococcus durrellii]|uniref:CHAP domain-containing protein n=1 Tax=Staphylococcus durrellii TaxID=2781773 RepID=UPI001F3ECC45|nr:CHAP domain-containing protein [Staphylococcus durrellii]
MNENGTAKNAIKKGAKGAKKVLKAVSKVKGIAMWKVWLTVGAALLAILLVTAIVGAVTVLISDELEKQQKQADNSGGCKVTGGDVDDSGIATFEKNAKGGALEGKSEYMVKSAKKHKIDPKIFMAIVAHETGYGKSEAVKTHNNVAGMMGSGELFKFDSIEDGIDAAAKNLYDLYFSKGLTTVEKIQKKYAPIGVSNDPTNLNSNWTPTIKKIMNSLGEDDKKSTSKVSCDSDVPTGKSIEKLKKVVKKNGGKLPKTKHKVFEPNTYNYKECTWYVYNRRKELGLPVTLTFGNGGDWVKKAKAQGYKTGKEPKVGAMVSWPYNSEDFGSTVYGHIAFVEEVKKNGEIRVSEHNIKPFAYGERTFKPKKDLTFIY